MYIEMLSCGLWIMYYVFLPILRFAKYTECCQVEESWYLSPDNKKCTRCVKNSRTHFLIIADNKVWCIWKIALWGPWKSKYWICKSKHCLLFKKCSISQFTMQIPVPSNMKKYIYLEQPKEKTKKGRRRKSDKKKEDVMPSINLDK